MNDIKQKPRPFYANHLPPCNNACPAGQNIQKWLSLVKQKQYRAAWEEIMQVNPIPAAIGRVCYHPCESSCNRFAFDSAININAVERFLGDMALEQGWKITLGESSGKKVLVVGSGPAGLTAAYKLRLLGHDVVILERSSIAGGMMHTGIPQYRLPREVFDAEIRRIYDLGVKIELNHEVTDLMQEKQQGKFDAVFVATGAQLGRKVNIPQQGNNCEILDAVKFLEDVEFNRIPKIKDLQVAVYGGGNTAIDAARVAVRLGAKEIEIVYRRNREKMPAYDFEVAEAQAEGVNFRLLRTIEKIDNDQITLNIMELNEEGWPCPTGETEVINADVVIMALGLNVETDFLRNIEGIEFKSDNTVLVDEHMMTGYPGIFAGGDMIPYDRSVTTAIGHGRVAALNINAYLQNNTYQKPKKHELSGLNKLNTAFYSKSCRSDRSQIDFEKRKTTFNEVVQGLEEKEVFSESARCFSCGNCFECDTCLNICPANAINKLGPGKGYEIDYEKCIRCGLCVRKCPCGAMDMKEDT